MQDRPLVARSGKACSKVAFAEQICSVGLRIVGKDAHLLLGLLCQ